LELQQTIEYSELAQDENSMRVVSLILLPIVIGLRLFAQSPCNTSGPFPFEDQGKWGYLSANGIVIPPRFDLAGTFTADGAIACVANQCGLLGRDGSFVTTTWNRYSRPFPENYSEGLAAANKDGHWGYLDRARNIVIPFKFRYAGQFDHGMARASEDDRFFFTNKEGARITPEFEGAFDFREGLAAVTVGKNVGYIRRDGTFALPPLHQSASGIDFSEGLAAVRVNGKVGFMDNTGNVVIEPKYDDVYPFSDGRAPVELRGKWGYVDKRGAVVVPIHYDIGHMFSEGLASVELSGKWGYIDTNGRFVIPASFDSAMPFCGGVAAVETFRQIGTTNRGRRGKLYRGKHGMIDHTGNYVWRDVDEQTWPSQF
jgi:WG containing repeat